MIRGGNSFWCRPGLHLRPRCRDPQCKGAASGYLLPSLRLRNLHRAPCLNSCGGGGGVRLRLCRAGKDMQPGKLTPFLHFHPRGNFCVNANFLHVLHFVFCFFFFIFAPHFQPRPRLRFPRPGLCRLSGPSLCWGSRHSDYLCPARPTDHGVLQRRQRVQWKGHCG